MEPRVLAVLGRGVVPLDSPVLRADDLGATRGDGVFETMHVRAGAAYLLDRHLARMADSARRLDLDIPSAADLEDLVGTALSAWPADREGGIKLVVTRGPEEDGAAPSVFALVFPIKDGSVRQRHEGIRVVSAPLGIAADARSTAPWLLGGVKSLSYAMNMATLRWAADRGLDDVVFVATDGQVLEGPTSSIVWLTGDTLRTIPDETGILPGITAADLLERSGDIGLGAVRSRATLDDLLAADGVWFCSSVRGIAPVTELDGKPVTVSPLADRLRTLVGYTG